MNNYIQNNYDATLSKNLSAVLTKLNLDIKNIIYSVQYISNEDVQIDKDGPQSSWDITLLCIEKTLDDYIFHINYSHDFHSYSYPYFKEFAIYSSFSTKLSELKKDIDKHLNNISNETNYLIKMWNDNYSYAFSSSDQNLISEMRNLSLKIMDIETIIDQQNQLKQEEYEKYLISDEYLKKQEAETKALEEYIKNRDDEYKKNEEIRLKLCIEKYGEEEGRRFHQRL